MILDVASQCTSADPVALCVTQLVDAAFLPANRAFVVALRSRRARRAPLDYREADGVHQWYWWSGRFRDRHLGFLLAHVRDPSAIHREHGS